jgi:VanZ family protein
MLTFPTPPYDGTVISWHDKIFHILLFGVFTYLLVYFLMPFKKFKLNIILAISALAGVSYSMLGEYIQGYIPGRTVSIYDFYAGASGIIIAVIFSYARFHKAR